MKKLASSSREHSASSSMLFSCISWDGCSPRAALFSVPQEYKIQRVRQKKKHGLTTASSRWNVAVTLEQDKKTHCSAILSAMKSTQTVIKLEVPLHKANTGFSQVQSPATTRPLDACCAQHPGQRYSKQRSLSCPGET